MNDDLSELQRSLELITAAQLPPDVELDRESAELRAAWSAFGKLLDAAQAGGEFPAQTLQPPRIGRRCRWPLVAIAVLAATVLLAITVALHLRRAPGSTISGASAEVAVKGPDVSPRSAVTTGSRPVKFSLVITGVTPRSPVITGNRSAGVSHRATSGTAKPIAAASRDTRQQWNDPLDQQMHRVDAMVMQVRDDSLASTVGSGQIRYQFEKIPKGIDEVSF